MNNFILLKNKSLHKIWLALCVCVLVMCSVCNAEETNGLPLDLMQKFAPDTYYITHFNGKDYVIQQEVFGVKKCKFIVYDANQSIVAKPNVVWLKVKKHRCIFADKSQKAVMKNFNYTLDDFTWRGTCMMDNHLVNFDFTEYRPSDYVQFTNRYKDEVFNYSVKKNVSYGYAEGYWTSNVSASGDDWEVIANGLPKSLESKNLNLTMDLYLPEHDPLESRPLLMLIHGGAFFMGDKSDNPIVLWSKHFASLGYVVASINYRMGFKPGKRSIERCGYMALQDAHAAMRYLLENKNVYHINPDYLFVAGSSAGGITALNLAFMRNENRPKSTYGTLRYADLGNIESSGNKFKQLFSIRAVGNMWGAVSDLTILKNAPTHIVSFHGDADKIVPYDVGVPISVFKSSINELFFDKMYGSASIHRAAQKLKRREMLYTFPKAGHAPHVDADNQPNEKFWFIQEKMTDFFYEEFVPKNMELRNVSGLWCELVNVGDADSKQMYWKIEGGFILEQSGKRARVLFREDAPEQLLSVSGKLLNGATVEASFSPTQKK